MSCGVSSDYVAKGARPWVRTTYVDFSHPPAQERFRVEGGYPLLPPARALPLRQAQGRLFANPRSAEGAWLDEHTSAG